MAFVLKKSRPISVPIKAGDEEFVLKVKRIKIEKLMVFYTEHEEAIDKLAATSKTKKKPPSPDIDQIKMMAEAVEIAKEAVVGWEGIIGEDGKPVEFSKKVFLDLVEQDGAVFGGMLSVLNAMFISDKSEKN